MSDLRREKVGSRSASIPPSDPVICSIGDREMANGELAVRTQSGEDLGAMSIDDFIQHVHGQPLETSANQAVD